MRTVLILSITALLAQAAVPRVLSVDPAATAKFRCDVPPYVLVENFDHEQHPMCVTVTTPAVLGCTATILLDLREQPRQERQLRERIERTFCGIEKVSLRLDGLSTRTVKMTWSAHF